MKLQKKNLLKYLKQDTIITGPNVNIGDMSDMGDMSSTTPTETNKVDDFSAADIPLVMKTTPIYGNDKYLWSPINKKKKRTDFYKSFELNEAKQEKIDHIFDSNLSMLGSNHYSILDPIGLYILSIHILLLVFCQIRQELQL